MKKGTFLKRIGLCLFAVTILMVLAGCSRKEIDIANYIVVSTSGYNTLGTASAEIDYEQLLEDYESVFKKDSSSAKRKLKKAEFDLSKDAKLSNGDKISVELKKLDTEALEEDFKVTIVCSDYDYTVKGLKELEAYDPFEYLTSFSEGYSGSGYFYVNANSKYSELEYKVNGREGKSYYSNGDVLTVTCDIYDWYGQDVDTYFAETYGLKLTRKSLELTVGGMRDTTEYDPSEAFVLEFYGRAPEGSAALFHNYDSLYYYLFDFEVDKYQGLSNGDVITVTLTTPNNFSSEEDFVAYCASYGLKVNTFEWKYTVEGLEEPVQLSLINYNIEEYGRTYYQDQYGNYFYCGTDLVHVEEENYDALNAQLDATKQERMTAVDEEFTGMVREFMNACPPDEGDYDYYQLNHSYYDYIDYDVCRADSLVFSFSSENYSDFGGAHPSYYIWGMNYDAQTGQFLDISDVVVDMDAFMEVLEVRLRQHEAFDDFYYDWTENINSYTWMLTENSLVVIYNSYVLAPYATGPIIVALDYYEFSYFLNNAYSNADVTELYKAYEAVQAPGFDIDMLVYSSNDVIDPDTGMLSSYEVRIPCFTDSNGYLPSGADNYNYDLSDDLRRANDNFLWIKQNYVDAFEGTDSPYSISYVTNYYQGIWSLCLTVYDALNYTDALCYSINFDSNGNEVSTDRLLQVYGLTEAEFLKLARESATKDCDRLLNFAEGSESENLLVQNAAQSVIDLIDCSSVIYIDDQKALSVAYLVTNPLNDVSYVQSSRLASTAHTEDRRTTVDITPIYSANMTLSNSGDCYYLRSNDSDEYYVLDVDTLLNVGVPAFVRGDSAMTWMERYLANAYDSDGDYTGFAYGDIITLSVGQNNHIDMITSIGFWD